MTASSATICSRAQWRETVHTSPDEEEVLAPRLRPPTARHAEGTHLRVTVALGDVVVPEDREELGAAAEHARQGREHERVEPCWAARLADATEHGQPLRGLAARWGRRGRRRRLP